MSILAPLAVILAFLCLLAWRERAHDRLTLEREQAWRIERIALLQRIQAPERAVAEQADTPERVPVPVIPMDDDERWEQLREERGNGRAD